MATVVKVKELFPTTVIGEKGLKELAAYLDTNYGTVPVILDFEGAQIFRGIGDLLYNLLNKEKGHKFQNLPEETMEAIDAYLRDIYTIRESSISEMKEKFTAAFNKGDVLVVVDQGIKKVAQFDSLTGDGDDQAIFYIYASVDSIMNSSLPGYRCTKTFEELKIGVRALTTDEQDDLKHQLREEGKTLKLPCNNL